MSGGNSNHTAAVCNVGSQPLGCYQVGTIGYHLDMLGWVPDNRSVVVEPGTSAEVTLDSLTTLAEGQNTIYLTIPIDGSNNFYTVEARQFIDYDRNLPGEAVILHQVTPGRSSPAHVVDADNNGNPNDEGAMWLPGEVFEDRRNGIRVEVTGRLNSTFTVRVSNMDN